MLIYNGKLVAFVMKLLGKRANPWPVMGRINGPMVMIYTIENVVLFLNYY